MRTKIDILRDKLYKLVRDNADFQQIYDVSVKLDNLIVYYYKARLQKKEHAI